MPNSFRMKAILALDNFLFFVFLITFLPFTVNLFLCYVIHLHRLVIQVTCCVLLLLLHSVFTVSVKFSRLSFLMCPINFRYLFLIESISFLVCFFLRLLHCSHVLSMVFLAFISRPASLLLYSLLHPGVNCPAFTSIKETKWINYNNILKYLKANM